MRNAGTGAGVQSVDRAISVLEFLARQREAGVSEVAVEIGVHKSTAFRLLAALEDRGMVEQAQDRGKYRLGFGVLRLAGAMPTQQDVSRRGRAACDRLAREAGETVNLGVLQGAYVVNVDEAHGPSAVSSRNWIGQLTPLHATSSGKVLLAHLDSTRRMALLDEAGRTRFTEHTVTSRRELQRQLAEAADRGYAVTCEEYEIGLNAMAAPIRAVGGEVVAALSMSGPAYRFTPERMAEVRPAMTAAAAEISERMGHLPTP